MSLRNFRFWNCCVLGCPAAAAIDLGLCDRCRQHFCALHASSPSHHCPKGYVYGEDRTAAKTAAENEELKDLRRMVNDQCLLRRASERYGGLLCALDNWTVIGNMYVHLRIRFSNGTTWLARILRYKYTSLSDELSNGAMEAECATLKWLENVDVPSPKLHDYGLRNDPHNDVGVAYMLIDELPGIPLLHKRPSVEELRRVYDGYAKILSTLHDFPFRHIGCLAFRPDGDICVGPIVGDSMGIFPRMGPFCNAREYYSTIAEMYLEMICSGQLFSAYPINAYLIFNYLKHLASRGRWNALEPSLDDGPFFLKHMGDTGYHILVDDQYNITGIIDWTGARVVPAFEAYGLSLLSADLNDFFHGKNRLSRNDKLMIDAVQSQASKLLRFAVAPDLVRRFSFGLGGIGKTEYWWNDEPLFQGIISTATGLDFDLDWEVWRQNRLYEWADDERLQGLMLRQGYSLDCKQLYRYREVQQSQLPRLATCSWACCMRPSVRGQSCARCRKLLCAKHQSRLYHNCASSLELSDDGWEKSIKNEIAELLSQTNTTELVRIGTGLNNGVKCTFIPGKHIESDAIMGCAKYQAWLSFDNGEKWLVQILHTGKSDVPSELVEYLVASEYATLRFLEPTKIPAPRAFTYGLASDPSNRVGVSYIVMEALPGRPFDAHEASPSQKAQVLEQVAEIMLEIHKNPVPFAGSPVVDKGQIQISTLAKDRFVGLSTSGPFTTSLGYILTITGQYMDLIADGQLHHEHPLEAFLFYHYLHHNGAAIVAADMQGSFFLKHVDDKGNHLLVDEEFNVVGIVSWQFARTVPASEAFGPSYLTADLASMYSCNDSITDDDRLLANALRERGAFDLASYAEGNDIMRRLHHGLGCGSTTSEVRCLLKGMVEAVSGEQIDDLDLWMESQWERCRRDSRWKAIHELCVEQHGNRVALGNSGDLRAYD